MNSRQSQRPNFAIVGAPRSGTTSLARWLSEHESAFVSDPKEPFFFADDFPNLRSKQGVVDRQQYDRLWRRVDERHVAVGEASSLYLSSRFAVQRLLEYAPDIKVVAILRNPIDLAFSFYTQMVLQGFETRDFMTAWSCCDDLLSLTSQPSPDISLLDYRRIAALGGQLNRLVATVPPGQLHLILFDELLADSEETLRRLCEFLGIPAQSGRPLPRSNESRVARNPLPRLLRLPTVRRVTRRAKLILPDSAVSALRRQRDQALYLPAERVVVSDVIHEEMRQFFSDDVVQIERHLGRQLGKKWAMGVE